MLKKTQWSWKVFGQIKQYLAVHCYELVWGELAAWAILLETSVPLLNKRTSEHVRMKWDVWYFRPLPPPPLLPQFSLSRVDDEIRLKYSLGLQHLRAECKLFFVRLEGGEGGRGQRLKVSQTHERTDGTSALHLNKQTGEH